MAWYNNPTVAATVGAFVGAVLTASVSIFIWKKTNKIRRVDCLIDDASSLLSIKVDPSLVSLVMASSLPFFGGYARTLMTVLLAQRLETAIRPRKQK